MIKEKIRKILSENFKFWEVVILMGLTSVVGIFVGGLITKNSYGISSYKSLSPALQEFITNYDYIANNYYGEFNEDELLNKALQKILEEIDDPYAAYLDETSSSNLNIQLAGSYYGAGVEVGKLHSTGQIIVTDVFENSPAQKAGIQIGDIIVEMNGESLDEMTTIDFSNKIKNNGETLRLTVLRDDADLNIDLTLGEIILQSVESNMFDNNIGYVKISIFADNTYEQLKNILTELEKQNMQSLIIDVRNNTGGYLASVEKILGLFLDSTHVIYQIEDKNGTKKYYSLGKETVDYDVVILTNEISASASEILTAALKEELGAVSIGKKTYGKGSAQKLHIMSDGTQYKFTTQKWLTPAGSSIDGKGIDVDYDVTLDSVYFENPTFENDNQLQVALEYLKNKKGMK